MTFNDLCRYDEAKRVYQMALSQRSDSQVRSSDPDNRAAQMYLRMVDNPIHPSSAPRRNPPVGQ